MVQNIVMSLMNSPLLYVITHLIQLVDVSLLPFQCFRKRRLLYQLAWIIFGYNVDTFMQLGCGSQKDRMYFKFFADILGQKISIHPVHLRSTSF